MNLNGIQVALPVGHAIKNKPLPDLIIISLPLTQVLHSLYENRLVLKAWSAGVFECMTKLHAQTLGLDSRIGLKV